MSCPTHPIQIACPEHRKLVRGTYQCLADGTVPMAMDGGYLLQQVRCSQLGGRCAQTLCALHRYNRGGRGSWYPDRIYALPRRDRQGKLRRRRQVARQPDLF